MALYLVGDEDSNAKSAGFFYLDPHIIQPSVPSTHLNESGLLSHMNSYHCTDLRSLDPDHMCASLATGFYLRDEENFEKWARQMKEVQAHFKQDSIYTVFDEKPAFMRELDGDDDAGASPATKLREERKKGEPKGDDDSFEDLNDDFEGIVGTELGLSGQLNETDHRYNQMLADAKNPSPLLKGPGVGLAARDQRSALHAGQLKAQGNAQRQVNVSARLQA